MARSCLLDDLIGNVVQKLANTGTTKLLNNPRQVWCIMKRRSRSKWHRERKGTGEKKEKEKEQTKHRREKKNCNPGPTAFIY